MSGGLTFSITHESVAKFVHEDNDVLPAISTDMHCGTPPFDLDKVGERIPDIVSIF